MAKPIPFDEQNKILRPPSAKPDGMTIIDLPVWSDGTQCVSCWKLSLKERVMALLFGKVWVALLSGHTQPPVYIEACDTYFTRKEEPKEDDPYDIPSW
jgi:hypothetical protein